MVQCENQENDKNSESDAQEPLNIDTQDKSVNIMKESILQRHEIAKETLISKGPPIPEIKHEWHSKQSQQLDKRAICTNISHRYETSCVCNCLCCYRMTGRFENRRFFHQNKTYRENAKTFYRELGEKSTEIKEPPKIDEVESFWGNIFEKQKSYDKNADWLAQIETPITEVNYQVLWITLEQTKTAIEKASS